MPVEAPLGQWLRVDFQIAPAKRLRLFAGVNALQLDNRLSATELNGRHAPRRFLTFQVQERVWRQALRPVGQHLHSQRASQALGADHAGGGQPLTRR
jgi:hypothetical protein